MTLAKKLINQSLNNRHYFPMILNFNFFLLQKIINFFIQKINLFINAFKVIVNKIDENEFFQKNLIIIMNELIILILKFSFFIH